jgi:uncharacterized protein
MSSPPDGSDPGLETGVLRPSSENTGPPPSVRQLSPRVVLLWRLQGAIATLAVTAVAAAIWLATRHLAWLLLAAALLVVSSTFTILASRLQYERWTYSLGAEALDLQHGVLTHRRSVVPYFRLQHIDVESGPLERTLGLCRLVVRTAAATTDASLPGIDQAEADSLRLLLLERAGRGDAV